MMMMISTHMEKGGFATGVLLHPAGSLGSPPGVKTPVTKPPLFHVCKPFDCEFKKNVVCFEMRGHRGYNICPWLKTGKNEICGKSCRKEYCKDHRHKIRNGSRIPRPCLNCGIGIRSQIQLCRGCGREKERQRLNRVNILLQNQNQFEDLQ